METNNQQENNPAPDENKSFNLKLTTVSHSAISGKNKAVPSLHHAVNLQTIIYLQADTKNIGQTHAFIHSDQAPHD